MKKTLFLSHILAAVVACFGISHAEDGNGVVEMTGNQTISLDRYYNQFELSVTGPNNWLKKNTYKWEHVIFAYSYSSKIVNGELSLENVKISCPDLEDWKFEMGDNSRLNLGGLDTALIWFNVTGQSVVFDNGVINLWENQAYTLGGNMGGTARVCLKDKSQLNLNGKTLSNPVYLSGATSISNGTVNGNLTLESDASFTWSNDLNITSGTVTLGDNTTLNLNSHTFSNTVTLNGSATFGGGTYNGVLEVKADKTLTLCGNLSGTGEVALGDNAKLNLGSHTLEKAVTMAGSATIGGGTYKGDLAVPADMELTLSGDLTGTGRLTLDNTSYLSLGGHTLAMDVTQEETAWIGDGTINGAVEVKAGKTLTLLYGGLSGTGDITLRDNTTLNLNLQTLSKNVVMTGNAFFGTGTYNGTLSVGAGKKLTLCGYLDGSRSVTLGDNAELNLNNNTLYKSLSMTGNATIGHGTYNGDLAVQADMELTLSGVLDGSGCVTLGDNTVLNLGGHTLGKAVTLAGSATIDGGTLNGALTVGAGKTLTLGGTLNGDGGVTLENGAVLNLGNTTLEKAVTLAGSATIGGGTLNSALTVGAGKTLTLAGNLNGDGGVTLGENATLNLGNATLGKAVALTGSATIGNGTLNSALTVEAGKKLTLSDDLSGTGGVSLSNDSTLDLDGNILSKDVTVSGDATINGGTHNGALTVGAGRTLTLGGNLEGEGGAVMLGDNAKLNLGNQELYKAVTLDGGSASIGNGKLINNLTVGAGKTLTLLGNLGGEDGSVILGDNATLDLGNAELDKAVRLEGSATIGNGTITGTLTVDCGKTLTLNGDPKAPLTLNQLDVQSGDITVTGAAEAKVSIGSLKALEETTIRLVHTNATTAGDTAYNGNLVIGEGSTVTAGSNDGWGGAYHDLTILKGGKLDLDDHFWKFTMYNNITLAGGEIAGRGNDKEGAVKFTNIDNVVEVTEDSVLSARVSVFGNENSVEFNVHGGKELAFTGNIVSIGGVTPDDKAVILKTGAGTMVMSGSNASANSTIIVQAGTLKVSGVANPLGTGTVGMAGGRLDLGGTQASLDKFKFAVKSAVVDNGTLTVAEGTTVTLGANLSGTDSNVSLGDNAVLDLAGNTLSMNVSVAGDATLGGGTQNGAISVAAGKTLTLGGNLNGTGAVTLDNKSTLDFGGKILSKDIVVAGEATVKNGEIDNSITIPGTSMATIGREGGKLWLGDGVTIGKNATFTMGDGAKLDLLWKTARLSMFTLEESATAYVYTGWLYVGEGESVTLNPKLIGSYELKLQGGTLDLGAGTLARKAIVTGHATMGNGTIGVDGSVIVNGGAQAHFSAGTHISGGAVTAGKTAIKALNTDKEGLLQELSVSDGLIAGTGRAASLADGLDINRMGYDLELKDLVLTANNKISVGDGHIITLNNVTIKLSQAHYDETEGVFLCDLGTLINCDLVMENVLLDASDLILPEGFDPATTSVVFDFGDDVTITQATGLDMRLGNYWSPSLNLDEQGKVIFTKLVDTPEPTTGTLSLLALAALAARRRK